MLRLVSSRLLSLINVLKKDSCTVYSHQVLIINKHPMMKGVATQDCMYSLNLFYLMCTTLYDMVFSHIPDCFSCLLFYFWFLHVGRKRSGLTLMLFILTIPKFWESLMVMIATQASDQVLIDAFTMGKLIPHHYYLLDVAVLKWMLMMPTSITKEMILFDKFFLY